MFNIVKSQDMIFKVKFIDRTNVPEIVALKIPKRK